jgi:hypothetical protein
MYSIFHIKENSCSLLGIELELVDEDTPRYSWNKAKVAVKTLIIQSIDDKNQ